MKIDLKYRPLRLNPLLISCALSLTILCLFSPKTQAQEKLDEIQIQLPRQTNTLYNIFNQISRQTGYFFIYDSDIIDSDEEVRIGRTRNNIKEFLQELAPDSSLEFKIVEKHILILSSNAINEKDGAVNKDADSHLVVSGRIFDSNTGEPLPYSTITLRHTTIGVTANNNGIFRLKLPEKYVNDTIVFSNLGYETQTKPVSILKQGFSDITMDFKHILLKEVVISYFDSFPIMQKALSKKRNNYPNQPTKHLSFYREGIFIEEEVMYYNESILNEHKPSYRSSLQDRMAVIQSRSISNVNREDTLVFKLKAGLQGAAQMDIIRNTPDFLDPEGMQNYNYSPAHIVRMDNNYAYAIEFEQKEHIREALHRGIIYIEKESYAIVRVDFEINRKYISDIKRRFIPRSNPNYNITIQSAEYIVSYRPYDEEYHMNHLKGELKFNVRPRNRLFSNLYRVFFEKGVVKIEKDNVERPGFREAVNKNIILSEKDFSYDHEFWGDYNIIVPEKEISEALNRISVKIESMEFE